ncbi:MAG: uroporphyrinogen decarboxylase family protein [Planctomycetota bacterium]
MTPYQRVMAALSGEQPDRVPVIPWVRDWCAVQAGFSIVDIMENIEKYVFAQYLCQRDFGYDAVFDLCGVCAESEAMGTVIRYDNETPPMAIEHPVQDYARDLSKLNIPNPNIDGRLPMVLEGIRRLKELCRGEIPVIGYLQGPLRHATMLRGPDYLLRDMYKRPEPLQELLDIATDCQMIYGMALIHAGADIIMVSDPSSSGDLISRKHWEKWGFPSTERLVKVLKRTSVKIILHICGNTLDRMDTIAELDIDCFSVDEKVDLAKARERLGDKICIFGNVNTTDDICLGEPEMIEMQSRECIGKASRNGPFILATGCITPMVAKSENIAAMVTAALKYGVY